MSIEIQRVRRVVERVLPSLLLAALAALAVAATLVEPTLADEKQKPRPPRRAEVSLRDLQHAHYADQVGERFVISRESKEYGKQSAVFVLVEAKRHPHESDRLRPPEVRKSAFSLLFLAETGERLGDEIWRVEHPRLGAHDLFLHKTRRDAEPERVFFVAVFN